MSEKSRVGQEIRKREKDKGSPDQRIPELLQQCKDLPWVCTACHFLLGWLDAETKTWVRIKMSDHWLKIQGHVIHICRKCGELNELTDSDFSEFLLHKKEFLNWLLKKRQQEAKSNKEGG